MCSSFWRCGTQEALHELEVKVLKVLRPQLEEVMAQEQQIKQLSIALAQTQVMAAWNV